MGRRRNDLRCWMRVCKQSAKWEVTGVEGKFDTSTYSKLTCCNHIVTAVNELGGRGWIEAIGDSK